MKFDLNQSHDFNDPFLIVTKIFFNKNRCKDINIITEIKLEINRDKIFKSIQDDFKIKITSEMKNFRAENLRERCNIFMLNSMNSMMELENKIISKHFKFSGYFLIAILDQYKAEDFELIFQKLWSKEIFNLYAMCRSVNNEILLLTFDPFMSISKCGKAIPNIINEYTDGKFSKPLKFEAKFANLNQCQIRVITFSDNIAVFKTQLPNGTELIDGHEVKIMQTIAKYLNFSINLEYLEGVDNVGTIYDNGTATHSFHKAMKNMTDIIIGDFYLRGKRMKFLDASISYLSYPIFFITSKGEKFSAIEKLFAPFDNIVWMFLAVSITAAFLVMKLNNFKFKNSENSKFIEYFKNPLNILLLTIFGSTQKKLPTMSSTRIFLMLLIISCLVMRSLYQASLYKFLQSDQRHKVPKTFEGLLEEGFEFYLSDFWNEMVEQNPKLKKLRRNFTNFTGRVYSIDHHIGNHSKRVTIMSRLYLNKYSNSSKTFPFKMINEESFVTVNIVQYFRKDFYLKDAIDEKLGVIISSGIIEKWISENDFTAYWNDYKPGPRVLTMSHLCGIFYILIMIYIISTFVFIIELYAR